MSGKKFVHEVKTQIIRRDYIKISPFIDLVQKAVRFEDKEELDLYHGVKGQDYVCILTKTDDGKIPLVRQYRPMVERYTWELPAGTLEVGESPGQCAIRELYEETGYKGTKLTNLGTLAADTGRLDLLSHGFYIHPVTKDFEWESEHGVDMNLFSESELFDLIRKGGFIHSMHIGWLGMMMLLRNSSLRLGFD